MGTEENKALLRLWWDAFNSHNLTVIEKYFSDNFVRYAHDGQTMDREGYRNMCEWIFEVTPDTKFIVDDMVAEGDKVAFRMTGSGTYNNKPSVIKEAYFARFDNGKIVEFHNIFHILD
ncbi:MAG TPA: ester cyclase [Dehalococcoidia bacterium]|nr:ester cyclase [Dehalococcoidia bacterium]